MKFFYSIIFWVFTWKKVQQGLSQVSVGMHAAIIYQYQSQEFLAHLLLASKRHWPAFRVDTYRIRLCLLLNNTFSKTCMIKLRDGGKLGEVFPCYFKTDFLGFRREDQERVNFCSSKFRKSPGPVSASMQLTQRVNRDPEPLGPLRQPASSWTGLGHWKESG